MISLHLQKTTVVLYIHINIRVLLKTEEHNMIDSVEGMLGGMSQEGKVVNESKRVAKRGTLYNFD